MDRLNNFNKKHKVIIDTDPGVDDVACFIHAFADENLEIKLFTTVAGNVSVEKSTRNLLHLLDIFNRNIPVAKGASKALFRTSPTAEFIHQEQGLGGYIPAEPINHKIIDKSAEEAMYEVINNGNGDIYPIILGPHTNIATLISKHPDIVKKIPKIYFMGGSPYGHPDFPDHISFNISSDPEAFDIVLKSGIPLAMIPSSVGRKKAHLDEQFVYDLAKINDVGKLMNKMYLSYWEPGFPDRRVATNDSHALLYLTHPELYSAEKVDIAVNTTDAPGKTIADFNGTGNVELVLNANRTEFLKLLINDIKKLNYVKIKF